ncbi:MAG: amino acid permease [Cytophagales bacterium]|jgi:APA family basic amino acid/polyamine antiporter|nr:amino acid permease [Cytophagales bacterium]MCA6386384.1 amino acid permease [Cytophagales bacterium]MCA6390445.1 amino acid permease [Cytophagales bacterium]MCA6395023.1 amino acid permease [Cytophagales bacterium]MCA6397933.1 amino acid permease [Cytophagales bacterium]
MASPKKIGIWTSTSLVMGNMIASAMFMLPATLSTYGSISLIGWVVSGLGAICLALVFSWLSQLMPVANGGPYAYTREGLGDFAAFLVAWGYWLSIWSTNAAIAVAFLSYLTVFAPALGVNSMLAVGVGLSAIWFLTWINTRGIRDAGAVQVITTILKIAPLLLVTFGGLFYIHTENYFPFNSSGTSDINAITTTATLTLFAFLGLECATIPSGQVENPEKTVPRATLYGTLAVTLLYILGTVVIMGVLSPSMLQTSKAPFADAAASMWGEWARYLVAGGAVMSTFGALNGWILMQGQIPAAAAVDKLFPSVLKTENKFGSPYISIIAGSVFVSFLLLMNFSRSLADTYQFIILLSTMTVLVPYLFSAVSFSILAVRTKQLKWNSATKLTTALLAFGYSMWAVGGSGQETVYWGFLLLMAGVPLYGWSKMRSS